MDEEGIKAAYNADTDPLKLPLDNYFSMKTVDDDVLNTQVLNKDKVYMPHMAAGVGLKVAMNENFVLSVDWAMALNKQDNAKWANFYIKMGYLF